jgi:hypothetical protein
MNKNITRNVSKKVDLNKISKKCLICKKTCGELKLCIRCNNKRKKIQVDLDEYNLSKTKNCYQRPCEGCGEKEKEQCMCETCPYCLLVISQLFDGTLQKCDCS